LDRLCPTEQKNIPGRPDHAITICCPKRTLGNIRWQNGVEIGHLWPERRINPAREPVWITIRGVLTIDVGAGEVGNMAEMSNLRVKVLWASSSSASGLTG
jgi:hypothetical protein